ncbi:MAG: protein translocase subunit SecF [Nanoarchaeota archaeon]
MLESEKAKTSWYNKNYKKLLLIPIILLILSLSQLGYMYFKTGQIIDRDITLTGGTSITIFVEKEVNIEEISDFLNGKIEEFVIRELSDFQSGKQKAIVIETLSSSEETKKILEKFIGYKLTNENSSIESTGSALGESFYKQLIYAVILSFFLMSITIFFIFRSPVPSFAVILSVFADIIMTIAIVNIIGIKISSAGIIAILMLIGYSVDTDIMLTTRLLKRSGDINENLKQAFKTGLTMTLTSIIAVATALIITYSISNVLAQIFSILIIGLIFDIINTWITNVIIMKWYLEAKK